jgi:site-specific DNA recombinase
MLLNRKIDRDSHQRMISKLKEEIAILRKKIEVQECSETGFMKYCRFGIPLLSNLSGFYMNASIGIKQKLLGSIFPAKLHYREDSYRPPPLNPALALILQKNKVLENEKTGQILFEESLSGELPMTGQLSNHFIEGMRKIYELEPFIKLESFLAEEPSKASKTYKRAV